MVRLKVEGTAVHTKASVAAEFAATSRAAKNTSSDRRVTNEHEAVPISALRCGFGCLIGIKLIDVTCGQDTSGQLEVTAVPIVLGYRPWLWIKLSTLHA